MNFIKIMMKRFLAGLHFGDGFMQKIKAAFGLVLISQIPSLSFVMKYDGHKSKVNFINGSDVAIWVEIFADKQYYLPPDMHPQKILDFGANVGFASLYFSMCYPNSEIIALEPDPQNLQTIAKNVAGVLNVKILPMAIDNESGRRDLFVADKIGMSSSFYQTAGTKKVKVQTISLGSLLSKFGWQEVDLIKFDIEGAEWELFQNFSLNMTRVLVGEYHEDIIGKPVADFVSLFKGFKSRILKISEKRFLVLLTK